MVKKQLEDKSYKWEERGEKARTARMKSIKVTEVSELYKGEADSKHHSVK